MQQKTVRYNLFVVMILATCFVLSGCCKCLNKNKECPLPSRALDQTSTVTATVVAIDYASRRVSLKMPDGRTLPVTVGEEAYNLDQVKAGDLVDITYAESFAISLEKDTGAQPSVITSVEMDRAPKGQKPEGVVYKTIDVRANVVEINYETRTVDLLGPNGDIISVVVDKKVDNLANIQKGDDVVARYTEAMAISVRPAKIQREP